MWARKRDACDQGGEKRASEDALPPLTVMRREQQPDPIAEENSRPTWNPHAGDSYSVSNDSSLYCLASLQSGTSDIPVVER